MKKVFYYGEFCELCADLKSCSDPSNCPYAALIEPQAERCEDHQ